MCGKMRASPSKTNRAPAPSKAKFVCHPHFSATAMPMGTPSAMALPNPRAIIPMALPVRSGEYSLATELKATTVKTPALTPRIARADIKMVK